MKKLKVACVWFQLGNDDDDDDDDEAYESMKRRKN
jgi:hypothetical protein